MVAVRDKWPQRVIWMLFRVEGPTEHRGREKDVPCADNPDFTGELGIFVPKFEYLAAKSQVSRQILRDQVLVIPVGRTQRALAL